MDFVQHLLTELAATPTPVPSDVLAQTGASTSTTVLTILSGAVGAALLGLLGAWIAHKRDHAKWIRVERLSAYREMLVVINTAVTDANTIRRALAKNEIPRKTLDTITDEFPRVYAAIDLVGPRRVADLAESFFNSVLAPGIEIPTDKQEEHTTNAQRAYLHAAGKVLKIKNE